MPPFIDALRTYLADLGHSPIYVGSMPDSPVNALAIYDAGGIPTELDENAPGADEQIDVQIRARNQSQSAARDALLAIQRDLHNLNVTDIGDWIVSVSIAGDRPAILSRDEKETWTLVANYEITAAAIE